MTEIALRQTSLEAKMDYARTLAVSGLLPKEYQKNPGNILYALEYAAALGIEPIHAITSIHVVSGKPTASADLIAGLVRRAEDVAADAAEAVDPDAYWHGDS